MEKELIEVTVSERIWRPKRYMDEDEVLCPIEDLIGWLIQAKENGSTHIHFRADHDEYSIYDFELESYYFREETDNEFNDRIKEEAETKKLFESFHRAMYDNLKARFDP